MNRVPYLIPAAFFFVVGAALRFASNIHLFGFSGHMIGVILMIASAAVLLIQLAAGRRRPVDVSNRTQRTVQTGNGPAQVESVEQQSTADPSTF